MKTEAARCGDAFAESLRAPAGAAALEGAVAPASGRAWQLFPGVALLLALVYVALPYGLFASAVYVVASFFAAFAIALAVRRQPRPVCPAAWALIACALALAATAGGTTAPSVMRSSWAFRPACSAGLC